MIWLESERHSLDAFIDRRLTSTMPQDIEYSHEGSRWLSPAWVIKVIAVPFWTKLFKYAREASGFQVGKDEVFGNVGEAEPVQRRLKAIETGIESQLPIDADADIAALVFELPCP